jgi:hypothetical protein
MSSIPYELAVDSWADTDSIEILSSTDSRIASFPLAFIQRGGNNTWQYVLDVVNQLVDLVPDRPGVITDAGDVPVNLADAPLSGLYRYQQLGASPGHGLFATCILRRLLKPLHADSPHSQAPLLSRSSREVLSTLRAFGLPIPRVAFPHDPIPSDRVQTRCVLPRDSVPLS